jgi:S-(hydroxymethyl)glutathione dehydrogenase/alcohol dehydrogenase
MKAAVLREFGKPLVIEELEIGTPQAGEIKVKMAACAICHSDIIYADGGWGGNLPLLLGHEAAGIIDEVGPGVTRLQVGDHVVVTLIKSCGHCYYCDQGHFTSCETDFSRDGDMLVDDAGQAVNQGLNTGAFAEYVVVDQSQVVVIPDDIPLDSASLLACGVITGLGAVTNTAQVPAGASVVVIGTGGVGLNSIQGAALSGAFPIIAIDLNDSKLEAAMEFGATHAINPRRDNALEQILALTHGRGAEYVFVAAGSGPAIDQGLQLVAPTGTFVMVGMPPIGVITEIEMANIAAASQTIKGSKMGSARLQIDVPKLVELYQAGRLKLDELITGRYPLDQINEAIDSARNGEALRNVIVFD